MSNSSTMSLPARQNVAAPTTGFNAVLRACYQAWLRAYGRGEVIYGH